MRYDGIFQHISTISYVEISHHIFGSPCSPSFDFLSLVDPQSLNWSHLVTIDYLFFVDGWQRASMGIVCRSLQDIVWLAPLIKTTVKKTPKS